MQPYYEFMRPNGNLSLRCQSGEEPWRFGDPPLSLFSTGISGAQRLRNGNIIICDGRTGRLVEITTEGEIVWEYMNPETFPWRGDQRNRTIFRAHRYAVNVPEIQGRV